METSDSSIRVVENFSSDLSFLTLTSSSIASFSPNMSSPFIRLSNPSLSPNSTRFPLNDPLTNTTSGLLSLVDSPTVFRIMADQKLSQHAIDGNNNCLFNAFALGLMGLIAQGSLSSKEIFTKLATEKIKEEKAKLSKEQWGECLGKMQDYLQTKNPQASLAVQHSLAPWLRQIAVAKLADEDLGIRDSFTDELCAHILDGTPSDLLRDKSDFVQSFESIKQALLLKKPQEAKSLTAIKKFETEVRERIRTWFDEGIGFKLYRDHMAKEEVWSGGPEARVLAEFLGITLILAHGHNPMRLDIGHECDFGQISTDNFTEAEYRQLRSKELILGKAWDPSHPVLKLAYVSESYLNQKLAELPAELSKKFSDARKMHYRPPAQSMLIHNPYSIHWITRSTWEGSFNVLDNFNTPDSKTTLSRFSSIETTQGTPLANYSGSESTSPALDERKLNTPMDPASPGFVEMEEDEPTKIECNQNLMDGFQSTTDPLETSPFTSNLPSHENLSFTASSSRSSIESLVPQVLLLRFGI